MKRLTFISKNLTQKRNRLCWLTEQKAKELNYKYICTNLGQIYVRDDEDSNRIVIKNEDNLDKLLSARKFACILIVARLT